MHDRRRQAGQVRLQAGEGTWQLSEQHSIVAQGQLVENSALEKGR